MAVTLVEAVNQALNYALAQDDKVVVFGQDVGVNGGVFRATVGLLEQYPERVLDTPLAENMLAGLAVGMSIAGLKPIVEIQFVGFIYAALEQIISHASRMRNRTRGRLSCPLVLRAPYGAGIHAPEHHSESIEALLAHIPGLRVVIPSSPYYAYGLLLAAIENPDPVIFLEPTRIYRKFRQELTKGEILPLDTSFILEEGEDVTIVSYGAMLQEVLLASEQLRAQYGIKPEVIDLATIKPIDKKTIINSVVKTGRLVIVHEAALTNGIGAEIAALVAEEAITSLLAPIKRVTGFDTVVPLSNLEHIYLPSVKSIIQAVQEVWSYG